MIISIRDVSITGSSASPFSLPHGTTPNTLLLIAALSHLHSWRCAHTSGESSCLRTVAFARSILLEIAGTTGNSTYAVRQKICRVSNVGHTANNTFAVCFGFRTRQIRGTRRTTLLPCVDKKDTRQTSTTRQNFESRYTCPIFAVCLRIKPTANPKHSANI